MLKLLKWLLYLLLGFIAIALVYALISAPPVMSGMAAKTMCSCVFVTGRTPESVTARELQVFPGLSSVPTEISYSDSTVTATVLWKTSRAIFRRGLGCTLLADMPEAVVRQQQVILADPPMISGADTMAWPFGNLLRDTLVPGVDYDAVQTAVNRGFQSESPDKPLNTHAIVVVHDGQIIAEQYANGFNESSRLMGWSMTKSITNALVGILVRDGKLSVDMAAPVPEWQNDERAKITINDLLHASSGLAWSESYTVPSSTFHDMFIRSDDKALFAAEQELDHSPGTFFEYSGGTTNILSWIIRRTVGDSSYYRFPYDSLFYRIGMFSAIMEPDASGTFVGSSYAFASARDWARFGLLYLNDGMSQGERVLPTGWVKYTTTPAPAAERGQYGAQWWLNHGANAQHDDRIYSRLPPDAFWADGFEEQYVMVIPSRKLVVVRLGVSHFGSRFEQLVVDILTAMPD
jgi:CubicO group peptidase (beta-lactamase class C family)